MENPCRSCYTPSPCARGVRCELVGFEGQSHGFFNLGRGEAFFGSLREADESLASLGWLKEGPTVEESREQL